MTLRSPGPEFLVALLAAHAPFRPVPLVPRLCAPTADDELPLWQAAEDLLGMRLAAPFWAVAWPGAQALARAITDGLVDVRGRIVVDLGCGSGVAGIAAARAGAERVVAVDIDPLAVEVASLCAAANGVFVHGCVVDPIAGDDHIVTSADVVLAGDVIYNVDTSALLSERVRSWRTRGVDVVLADSGRPFFEADGALPVARYEVEVPRAVEGVTSRVVTVYRHPPPNAAGAQGEHGTNELPPPAASRNP
jgi:predicted nicotinamide N-methyase